MMSRSSLVNTDGQMASRQEAMMNTMVALHNTTYGAKDSVNDSS